MMQRFRKHRVVSTFLSVATMDASLAAIFSWVSARISSYVCLVNTHSVVSATENEDFQNAVNCSDLSLADSRVLFWIAKARGLEAEHLRGGDLTKRVLALAEKEEVAVGFFGSTREVLDEIERKVSSKHPGLKLACLLSPPFGEWSNVEIDGLVSEINASGVQILFVGLGCPKQELWMSKTTSGLRCVQIGVGAVFEFLAFPHREAPRWVSNFGLEWFFRLVSDPKRLWHRYLTTIPLFLWLFFVSGKSAGSRSFD